MYLILLSIAYFKVPSEPSLICKIISCLKFEFSLIEERKNFTLVWPRNIQKDTGINIIDLTGDVVED